MSKNIDIIHKNLCFRYEMRQIVMILIIDILKHDDLMNYKYWWMIFYCFFDILYYVHSMWGCNIVWERMT